MAETLFRRCARCGEFVPECEQLCAHCGHNFDTPPSKRNAKRWWITSMVFWVVVLLLVLPFIIEGLPAPNNSEAPVASRPTWTRIPVFFTREQEDRTSVQATATQTTATQTPNAEPLVRVDRNMNVRGGPGVFYPIVGSAWPGDAFPIVGRNATGDWWRIHFQGTPAWIYAPLVTAIGTEDGRVAVFIPPKLTSVQIFNKVSPAIAFVQTDESSGSGVLIEGGYLVTNHHVVWPYETARVVFPNGSEYDSAPVKGWDREADLAVLGPINVAAEPALMIDGEAAPVGADMYLIGYPAEFESYPQPTIAKGILSRLRQSGPVGITYFQIDASIAGGQSGGALVSETGAVIGISGFSIADGKFALAASVADLAPRIRKLISGGGGDPVAGEQRRRAVVNYDGGVDLLGLGLQQGEERLSVQDVLDLKRDRPFWVGMRWQSAPELHIDYAISLRLYDTSGRRVYQQDEALTDSESRPTGHWSSHEPVDTWFQCEFPADLSLGVYELRLVVYNIETLTPTVEIDVWEPELLLARVQLGEGQ